MEKEVKESATKKRTKKDEKIGETSSEGNTENITEEMGKEVIIPTLQSYALTDPQQMIDLANILSSFIKKNKLSKRLTSKKDKAAGLTGREYVFVEGWQFAGSCLGLIPIITEVTNRSTEVEFRYEAKCELRRLVDNAVMGIGIASCSSKEERKKTFDEFAVESMCQTRAIAKAYRNLLGWLMKAAGYSATPAEEMPEEGTSYEELPPIAIVPDNDKKWLEADTEEYTEAVELLRKGYDMNDIRNRWKISRANASRLEEDKEKEAPAPVVTPEVTKEEKPEIKPNTPVQPINNPVQTNQQNAATTTPAAKEEDPYKMVYSDAGSIALLVTGAVTLKQLADLYYSNQKIVDDPTNKELKEGFTKRQIYIKEKMRPTLDEAGLNSIVKQIEEGNLKLFGETQNKYALSKAQGDLLLKVYSKSSAAHANA